MTELLACWPLGRRQDQPRGTAQKLQSIMHFHWPHTSCQASLARLATEAVDNLLCSEHTHAWVLCLEQVLQTQALHRSVQYALDMLSCLQVQCCQLAPPPIQWQMQPLKQNKHVIAGNTCGLPARPSFAVITCTCNHLAPLHGFPVLHVKKRYVPVLIAAGQHFPVRTPAQRCHW